MTDTERQLLADYEEKNRWAYALAYAAALEACEGKGLKKGQVRGVAEQAGRFAALWVLKLEKYEIKEMHVEPGERVALARISIGMKGDEGTMAEYTCRNVCAYLVGVRGGVKVIREGR